MKWEDAIIQVLREEGRPMSSMEITNNILDKGYREAGGRPEKELRQTVAGILSEDKNGRFEHVLEEGKCKGKYKLKEILAKDKIVALKTSGRVAPVVVVRPCTSYKPGDSKYKEAKDFVDSPVLSDLEMKLLELIVNFRLPLANGEVCFADILDKDKLDVDILEKEESRTQSVDETILREKLGELKEQIADMEREAQLNPQLRDLYGPLLNPMHSAAEEAEQRLQGASDGKVEFEIPLFGKFVPGNKESKPKVVIYLKSIENNLKSYESRWDVMAGVFVHEMFHAWNYFNAGRKSNSVLAIDEPMVEFETLYFLKKLEAFTKSQYHSLKDKVLIVRSNRESRVHNKQQSIGNVAAYGFGYYLFNELSKSDADSIVWIETYYKKLASISRDPNVKKVKKALIPVYPFKSENEVKKWFKRIIFSKQATYEPAATKVDLSVSLYDLVYACIKTIGRKCFEAKELYAFAPIFKVCMPQCENLEDALKNQLDELVKEGLLDALPHDCYSMKLVDIEVISVSTSPAPTKFKGGYTKDQSIPFAVEFLDDKITIKGKTAVETFIKSLKHIGLSNVQHLGIMIQGYNLVSDVERPRYGKNKWQDYVDDKYIYTKLSNHRKITYLYEIANELGINIKIYDI